VEGLLDLYSGRVAERYIWSEIFLYIQGEWRGENILAGVEYTCRVSG